MMKLRIDTTGMEFMAAGPPEPVVDFDTKQPKTDESGAALHSLQLVVLGEDGADVINVKFPGSPKGVGKGSPVRVTGLVAVPWSMNDRSGVAFRAASVEALPAAADGRAAS